MAFVINQNAAVWWNVTFKTPCEGGAIETQQIKVKFKRMKRREAAKFAADVSNVERSDDIDHVLTREKDLLSRVIIDWEGIETTDGEKLEFSADNLTRLLECTDGLNVTAAIFRAYFEFLKAEETAAEKN